MFFCDVSFGFRETAVISSIYILIRILTTSNKATELSKKGGIIKLSSEKN